MAKELPTIERLRELLDYDPETGVLRWQVSRGRNAKAGSVAGTPNRDGYIHVKVDGVALKAHRIAWAMHNGEWPSAEVEIDHVDMDKANNQIKNLRTASRNENQHNLAVRADNTSGVKGLSFRPNKRLWLGQIMLHGKNRSKSSKDRAVVEAWLISKREELHEEFARHA